MTTIDVDALRRGLTRERRELEAAIASDEAMLRRDPDPQVEAALELRRSELRKVEHALQRHEAGTWRDCEQCGEPITDDQLGVLATVTHCTTCAEGQVYWGDTLTIRVEELGLEA